MSELALKLIRENKELHKTDPEKAKFLDLGNCGLTDLPKELFECVWIEELNLGEWYFDKDTKTYPNSKNHAGANRLKEKVLVNLTLLSNLKTLTLSENQISDGSFLVNLSKLTYLDLFSNRIRDISFLKKLTNLNSLDLGRNIIRDISFLEKLTNLNSLDLSLNKISDIRFVEKLTNLNSLNLHDCQLSDISFLEKLTNLTSLDLSENQISDYSFLEKLTNLTSLYLSENQISDYSFLEKLTNLTSLYLSNSKISDYSFLEKLNNLTSLDLRENKISDIRFVEKLTNLTSLDLSENKISDISSGGVPLFEKLTNLTSLDLSENQISDIKALLPLFKKGLEIDLKGYNYQGKINLRDNPITNPPIEIVKQGREAVIRYFEKLENEGKDYIYEAKLTLVGEGGAGKTSLQTRIINKKQALPTSEERTRGIKVSEWSFTGSKNDIYRVNIWDFGGQDVYFPVHRFFLTDNSVYVLMATTRVQSHNFEYWIPTIYQFGGSSPIILVQTCYDGNKAHWNELSNFYSNSNFKLIKPHYEVNLPNKNEGLERLEKAIEHQIVALPHIGEPVPASWKLVREKLSDEKQLANCVSYERFAAICREVDKENFSTEKDIELIGRFFADLGIILWYYDKEYLKDWVILQPQWAMNAVYKIIDDGNVQECGIIHKSDFDRLWNEDDYARRKDLLRKMLQEFKIAFPKKSNANDYLLPIRLKSLPKEKQWTNIDKTIRLQYDFDFMPRGIVNQLSAELSRYIVSDSEVWNNAVNLSYNGSEAQVEEDFFNRKISIKANGKEARSLVVLVMDAIDNTLQGYKGVKTTIQVPCSCEVCKSNADPTLFPYLKLLEWIGKNPNVRCNESGADIAIRGLLYEVGFDNIRSLTEEFIESELRRAKSKKIELEMKTNEEIPEIFFSYAWGDAQETGESREDIVNKLYDSLKSDGLAVKRDKVDLGYKGLISDFMDNIGKGKGIVVALSEKYLKSEYCMYELYQIFRNSKLEADGFIDRIFPIRVENIDISSPKKLIELHKYWDEKKQEWEELAKLYPTYGEDFERINDIHSNLGRLIKILKDINSSTKELLSDNNFEKIKSTIKQRIGQ